MSFLSLEQENSVLEKEYEELKSSLYKFEQANPPIHIDETDEDAVILKETMLVSTDPKISLKISDAVSRMYTRGEPGTRIIKAVMNEKQRTIMNKQLTFLKCKLIKKWYERWYLVLNKDTASCLVKVEILAKDKIAEVLNKQQSLKTESFIQEQAFEEEERALLARREAFKKSIVEKDFLLGIELKNAKSALETIRSSIPSHNLEFYSFVSLSSEKPRTELEFIEQLDDESARCEQTIKNLRGF